MNYDTNTRLKFSLHNMVLFAAPFRALWDFSCVQEDVIERRAKPGNEPHHVTSVTDIVKKQLTLLRTQSFHMIEEAAIFSIYFIK